MENKGVMIVYGGAFNPLTAAHESAIRALSRRAGAGELVLLPSGAEFVEKWKPGQAVLSDVARLDILRGFVKDEGLANTRVDTLALRENLCTFDALARLGGEGREMMFVIGEDKLPELPRWAHAEELVKNTSFVVLNYEKKGAEELKLEGFDIPVKVEYLRLEKGTENVHATDLRERMRRHDASLMDERSGRYMAQLPECLKICACAPFVYLANPGKNAEAMIECMENADGDVLVFPELSISGYTCADLFLAPAFLRACEQAAAMVAKATAKTGQLVYFGCPVVNAGRVYDCAVAALGGKILAVIPKTHIAEHGEAYEKRWFASAADCSADTVSFCGEILPFGTDILLCAARGGAVIAAEIGEDAWAPINPGMRHAVAGANVIVNLAACNELVGRRDYCRDMIRMLSARGVCAYAYASSGAGESTTDCAYAGNRMIFQNGKLLGELRQPVASVGDMVCGAVIDISMLEADRLRMGAFGGASGYRRINYDQATFRFPAKVSASPFIPEDSGDELRCRGLEILELQQRGLVQRVRSIGVKKLVIGISGGLDSTLALIVAHNAVREMGMPDDSIIAITMPGVATSSRTLKNATDLCKQFGTDFRTITIGEACRAHELDIGHDPECHDVTYENVQARERTQILMDVANM